MPFFGCERPTPTCALRLKLLMLGALNPDLGQGSNGYRRLCGKPVFVGGNHTNVLEATRREHSRKPQEFYAVVEAARPRQLHLIRI
jgi:hypothetical protein